MIQVAISEANFEYDIHSLVKAFFPKEEVKVEKKGEETVEAPILSIGVDWDRMTLRLSLEGEEKSACSVEGLSRLETKNVLKRQLYHMLSGYTGQNLPWGTMTGIRPTKVMLNALEEGKTPSDIAAYMRDTYLVSGEKLDLGMEIATREREILKELDYENGYSLYIGIPFCPSTCLYCSFTSYPVGKWAPRMEEYLDALEKEIIFTATACKEKKLNTVYIGGGTPTSLTAPQLDRLLTAVGEHFDFSHLKEYTVEAGRPDSITEEKLLVLKKHGVTRISINPQTMKQETLDFIGRHHTVEQTKESFALARSLGFTNINMDLIVGLPGETMEDVEHTMEELALLDPDSITVHSLAIKRAARLRLFSKEHEELTMENSPEIMNLTARYARKAGLLPYYLYRQKNMAGNFENVGYAREGKAGIYNILIMEEKQTILALGAGTVTKYVWDRGQRIERTDNVKDVDQYLSRIDEMLQRKKEGMELYF